MYNILEEAITLSRRRRNRSVLSTHQYLLNTVVPPPHYTGDPSKYPIPECVNNIGILFGPNIKFEMTMQDMAAGIEYRRVYKEVEDGLLKEMIEEEMQKANTAPGSKRKLGSDEGNPSSSKKSWWEKEVIL